MSKEMLLACASLVFNIVISVYTVLLEKRLESSEDGKFELINHFNKKYSDLVNAFNALSKELGSQSRQYFDSFSEEKKGPKHYIPSKDIDTVLKGKQLDVFD